MSEAADVLERTAMFAPAARATLEALASQARVRELAKGEHAFLEGATGNEMFVVDDGLVKLSCTSREGDEVMFRTVGPGGTFGELSALDGGPRSASAVAVSPTRLLVVHADALKPALRGDPDLAESVVLAVASALRLTTRQHADLVFLDLPSRVAAYLLELSEAAGDGTVALALNQADLGALLGASRQSVNQVLRKFEADGLVVRRGRTLELVGTEELRARAGAVAYGDVRHGVGHLTDLGPTIPDDPSMTSGTGVRATTTRGGVHYAKGDFHRIVRARVAERLAESGRTYRGGARAWLGAAPAVLWFYGSFVALLVGPGDTLYVIGMTVSLGLASTACLTIVQHAALHQTISSRRWVNWATAYVAAPVGASWRWWTAKHSGSHHAYTNVDGHDGDLEQSAFLRLTDQQDWRPWHRFQHLYVWALYGMLGLAIQATGDLTFIVHGRLKDGKQVAKPSIGRTAALFTEKLAGLALLLGIAAIARPTPWLVGVFVLWSAVAGFALAGVFALTHYVETSTFPVVSAAGSVADEWAVTQVVGTTNLRIKNPVVRWYFGGVDHHIEHHLFPRMSPVHYPVIAPVVRATCEEYGMPYHEAPSLRAAYASHARFLRTRGRRPVDASLPRSPAAARPGVAAAA